MPISHESQYILDSCYEMLLLTPDVCSFIYTTDLDVDAMVDRNEESPDRKFGCLNLENSFKVEYQKWRESASDEMRALVSYQAILNSEHQLSEFVGTYSSEIIYAFLASLGYVEKRGDSDIEYRFNSEADLLSEENIQRFLSNDWIADWCRMFVRQWCQFLVDADRVSIADVAAIARKRMLGKITELPESGKLSRKQAAKVLRKSSELFRKHVGDHNLKAFLSGEGFRLEGKEFDYLISKSANTSLVKQAIDPNTCHIPYDLYLYDKEGNRLGDMCVYFEGTPALDQIVAMVLHVRHDEENRILEKANIFRKTAAYHSNTGIQAIKQTAKAAPVIASPAQFSSLSELDEDEVEAELHLKYRSAIREHLFNAVDIPNAALEFMNSPPVRFDEFRNLSSTNLLPRLQPILEIEVLS